MKSRTLWLGTLVAALIGAGLTPAQAAETHPQPAAAPAAVAAPGGYVPVTSTRVLDTRSALGAAKTAVPAGGTISLAVLGVAGVPASGVSSIALDVTAISPARSGAITVFDHGSTRPAFSNLPLHAGRTGTGLTITSVGTGGRVDLYNGSTAPVQLLADAVGYYVLPGGTPTQITVTAGQVTAGIDQTLPLQ